MNRIELGGQIGSALTHLAMFGLAGILEEADVQSVRVWWSDAESPVATITWTGPTAGEIVAAHAGRHAGEDDWVQQVHDHEGSEVGLFSPRITDAKTTMGWELLQRARNCWLDKDLTWLDQQMIGSLGEPGHWLVSPKDAQPDGGATRWEMVSRLSGRDFVQTRLGPLAKKLVAWSVREWESSLRGIRLRDVVTKSVSRTPTGLTLPRQTDAGLAWCALWGIAAMPLVPIVPAVAAGGRADMGRAQSRTAGTWPRDRVHPGFHVLPVWSRPVSRSAMTSLMRSSVFDKACFGGEWEKQSASAALRGVGLTGLMRFPVRVAGTSNQPERMLLSGSLELLNEAQ